MNTLACYIRLSMADGDLGSGKDESNSISNQRSLLHQYIDTHPEFSDWAVQEFVDDGYTGTNDSRPEFQRMIEMVQQGLIQCILVKDLSRFARNYIITGEYLEQVFPFLGVRFISINDHYDSAMNTTVEDNMSVVLKSVLNTYYSKDLGRKIISSIQQRVRQGTYKSRPPYGYRRPDGESYFEIDPEAAQVVRKIFDLALEQLPAKEIANQINALKIPPPALYNRYHSELHKAGRAPLSDNVLWQLSNVLTILRNQAYTGDLVLHKVASVSPGSKKRRSIPPEEWIIQKGHHAPIVSHEEFEQVQKLYPKKKIQKRRPSVEYTLKGVVRCGKCRRLLHNYAHSYFTCRFANLEHSDCPTKRFPVEEVETAIFDALKPMLLTASSKGSPSLKKRGASSSENLIQCRKEIRNALFQEQRCKQSKLDAYEDYSSGKLSLQDYQKKRENLSAQAKEIKNKLEILQAQEKSYAAGDIPHDVKAVTDAAAHFRHSTSLTREMVTTFLESVYVFDDHYEFQWKDQTVWDRLMQHQKKPQ